MSSRAVAAQVLQRVIYNGESLTEVLRNSAISYLSTQDQGLVRDVCFGSLRWHGRLSAILDVMLLKPLRAGDKDVECLLRVGLYQLIYQRTPDHAAVNETVKAARKLKKPWAGSLINGVLRGFLRQRDSILEKTDTVETAHYAFPAWLLERLRGAWPEDWQTIVEASNVHPPMSLRVNLSRQSRAHYLQTLHEAGLQAAEAPSVDSGVNLEHPIGVEQIPGFEQGMVSVQDAAAQLAPVLLDCQPGMRVLDACAAPGGKTGHLLETTPDLRLIAIDRSESRLWRVTENLRRLNLQAEIVEADVGDVAAWWDGQAFERILLDAPCSASGVIRRHPDIKLLRRETDIAQLQEEQARILQALWPTLKPGGLLLYVTCSILPEENHQQVGTFLAGQKDALHRPIDAAWGRAMQAGRQILPGENGMDGFYYALLEKAVLDSGDDIS